jgi:hypothetical protein
MEAGTKLNDTAPALVDDLLRGAFEISEFIFGDTRTYEDRRKVYYLAECSRLPVFRLGSMLCARRSVLLNCIAGRTSSRLGDVLHVLVRVCPLGR